MIFYDVRSERELILTIPERIDWLWFLEYDIDDDIPNHSVLSKARARWGVEAFKTFFERIVWQCVQAGLVDGSKIFMDSSMVQADASNNSVVNKESLIDTHENNTEASVETAVADSKYGSIGNYLACRDRDIKAHFSSLEQTQNRNRKRISKPVSI